VDETSKKFFNYAKDRVSKKLHYKPKEKTSNNAKENTPSKQYKRKTASNNKEKATSKTSKPE